MFRNHIVRILGVLAAFTPLLVSLVPQVDWVTLIPLSIALLGGAEAAQRLENQKTANALAEPSPDLAAELAQARLALREVEHASTVATAKE
ncbi:hypothetical protein DWB77_02129 [Streptomyces hundungensis]|uniref:Uncharacterized protein n=1 Tax=Streptomyces hundungensis TaxID=1077946 RepID=A0A387H9G7_9ACTN|nr:hypothetical protein [Streptomyces hundungensis]AYG80009.1 hypothetical protein DWB77_02129 [Streptomyces hundungensis]